MFRRSRRPVAKRYSLETTNVNTHVTGITQTAYTIVPPIGSYGKRKVKNFTLQLGTYSGVLDEAVIGALVYQPEGTGAGNLNTNANGAVQPGQPETVASAYEPSQNVIMSFVIPPGSNNTVIKKSFLARNLDSGDKIVLLLKPYSNAAQTPIMGTVSYAIKY